MVSYDAPSFGKTAQDQAENATDGTCLTRELPVAQDEGGVSAESSDFQL